MEGGEKERDGGKEIRTDKSGEMVGRGGRWVVRFNIESP